MRFEVTCPNCNQSLEADEDMDGMEVACPTCNNPFVVQVPQNAILQMPDKQDCPFCGEEILVKAKKCKHCGEFLDASMKPTSQVTKQAPAEKTPIAEKKLWESHTSHMYYLGAHIVWGLIGCVTLIGFLGNLYYFLLAKSMKFRLTNRRVSSEKGILSKQTAEVRIKDIRSVNLKQGMFERLFSLGTVEIGSAGTAGIEVALSGISQPGRVKEQITKLQNELL